MKKEYIIFFGALTILVFSTSTLFFKKPYVLISGQVNWPEYVEKFGPMVIEAVDPKFNIITFIEIRTPQKYTLKVPRSAGQVSLNFNLKNKDIITYKKVEFKKKFPLSLDSLHNICDVDIQISEAQVNALFENMGPAIVISGNIIFKDYDSKGDIIVMVNKDAIGMKKAFLQKTMAGVGKYSIEVPKNFGPAYIWVIYLNPIKMSLSRPVRINIDEIDITNVDLDITE